ncbi:MAG: restriction endonuclease, SacI family [Hyphomicrobiales bacterium]|nr:restriction endonuclease, SacI family [Hyphomicrobiales bacterium]
MGRSLNYDAARRLLTDTFALAEIDFAATKAIDVPASVQEATAQLFTSKSQSPRETLIGCTIARILDADIDIRAAYASLGEAAFNGRSLDETVINPFLSDKTVPCSKGPYLAMFRRSVRFDESTAAGVRDQKTYQAMLQFITELEIANATTATQYLRYLLYAFVQLRDAATITLHRIKRLSVEQYDGL